jgi:hypothetical protein
MFAHFWTTWLGAAMRFANTPKPTGYWNNLDIWFEAWLP